MGLECWVPPVGLLTAAGTCWVVVATAAAGWCGRVWIAALERRLVLLLLVFSRAAAVVTAAEDRWIAGVPDERSAIDWTSLVLP